MYTLSIIRDDAGLKSRNFSNANTRMCDTRINMNSMNKFETFISFNNIHVDVKFNKWRSYFYGKT